MLKTVETTLGETMAVLAQDFWSNVLSVRRNGGLSAMPYSPLKAKAHGVLRSLVISENQVSFLGDPCWRNQVLAVARKVLVSVFVVSPRPRCCTKFALFKTVGAQPLPNYTRT